MLEKCSLVDCVDLLLSVLQIVVCRVGSCPVLNLLQRSLEEALVLSTLPSLVVNASDGRNASRVTLKDTVDHVDAIGVHSLVPLLSPAVLHPDLRIRVDPLALVKVGLLGSARMPTLAVWQSTWWVLLSHQLLVVLVLLLLSHGHVVFVAVCAAAVAPVVRGCVNRGPGCVARVCPVAR